MGEAVRLGVAAFALAALNCTAGTLHVSLESTNPVPPYATWATAATKIQDAVDAALAGDEIVVTNGIYATGGRTVGTNLLVNRVAADKPLTLRSVNGPQFTVIQGYQVPGTTNGDGAIRCVYLTSGANLSGFTLTNGATRCSGGEVLEQSGGGLWCESFAMLVTNCILAGNSACYEGGGVSAGTLTHCTLTGNSAEVGGGASGTILDNSTLAGNSAYEGGAAYGATLVRCTLAGNSAPHGGAMSEGTLAHCWLTGNSADAGGGAAWADLYDCTLTSNSASEGGGAYECVLNNCTLTDNEAYDDGGATHGGRLNNCTVTGNSAQSNGGVSGGTLNNCIVYYNVATTNANYTAPEWETISLNYCCTTPMPTNGFGNITNAPLLLDYGAGNLRLQSNSACINSGNNAYAPSPTDLDGLPRIVSGTVDIGAYEFQGPGSTISYAWLQQYGLPTDGSADDADPDRDGMSNGQEYLAATNPLDAQDNLRIISFARGNPTPSYTILRWTSKPTRMYAIQRRSALNPASPWQDLYTMPSPGTDNAGFDQFGSPYFYRIRAFRP